MTVFHFLYIIIQDCQTVSTTWGTLQFDTLEEATKARKRAEEEIYQPYLESYDRTHPEKQ